MISSYRIVDKDFKSTGFGSAFQVAGPERKKIIMFLSH
jgi:hypothetical protein